MNTMVELFQRIVRIIVMQAILIELRLAEALEKAKKISQADQRKCLKERISNAHYNQIKMSAVDGKFLPAYSKKPNKARKLRKCLIKGCTNKYYARGFCSTHHRHFKKGSIDAEGKSLLCSAEGCTYKKRIKSFCRKHAPVTRECSIKKCKKIHAAKDFCKIHYRRYRCGQIDKLGNRLCSNTECRNKHHAKGLCQMHYDRNNKKGRIIVFKLHEEIYGNQKSKQTA